VGPESLADEWADRYGALRHGGPGAANAWLGIPLVVGALLGILWSVPLPAVLSERSPVINPATLFVMATFVYYCILSLNLALGGLLFLIAATLPAPLIEQAGLPLLSLATGAFAPAFAWQLLETKRATGRLRIVQNLQYLMLGPLWLLRGVYRAAGIAY